MDRRHPRCPRTSEAAGRSQAGGEGGGSLADEAVHVAVARCYDADCLCTDGKKPVGWATVNGGRRATIAWAYARSTVVKEGSGGTSLDSRTSSSLHLLLREPLWLQIVHLARRILPLRVTFDQQFKRSPFHASRADSPIHRRPSYNPSRQVALQSGRTAHTSHLRRNLHFSIDDTLE